MYAVLAFLFFFESVRSKRFSIRWWILGALLLCFYGGLLEIAQEWCTETRSGDWGDWLADVVGVLIGWGIVAVFHKAQVKQ